MELFNEILKNKEVSYYDLVKKFGSSENVNVDKELENLKRDGLIIEEEGLMILAE